MTSLLQSKGCTPSTKCAAATAMKQAPISCVSSMSRGRSIFREKETDTCEHDTELRHAVFLSIKPAFHFVTAPCAGYNMAALPATKPCQ